MFAPKIAKEGSSPLQRSATMTTQRGSGDSSRWKQFALHRDDAHSLGPRWTKGGENAPAAGQTESQAAKIVGDSATPTWNLSKIPIFASQQTGSDQVPYPLRSPRPSAPLQARLEIGAVNDPLEHEADCVAERVMQVPSPLSGQASPKASAGSPAGVPALQRKCACAGACEDCRSEALSSERKQLHRKATTAQSSTPCEAPPIVHQVLQSPGRPLDPATRAFMEPRFGRDFSHVRLHSGESAERSAQEVGARAYTVGHNIVLGAEARSATCDSRRLIAHELAHVVQQGGGTGSLRRSPEERSPKDVPAERTCAYEKGEQATASTPHGVLGQDVAFAEVFGIHRGDEVLVADFPIGQAEMRPGARAEILRRWIPTYNSQSLKRLEFIGYTDCAGREKNNEALRKQRADSVAWLFGRGAANAEAAPPNEFLTDNASPHDRALNRSVLIRIKADKTMPPKKTTTDDTLVPAPTSTPVNPTPTPQAVDPVRTLVPVEDPFIVPQFGMDTIEGTRDGGSSGWGIWAIRQAASVLGIATVVFVGLSEADLAGMLEAAWIAIQISSGGLNNITGKAAEAVAMEALPKLTGVAAHELLDLNTLSESFPVIDTISPAGVVNVKSILVASALSGAALDKAVIGRAATDFISVLDINSPRMNKAAKLLLEHRSELIKKGVWPIDLTAVNEQGIKEYVINEMKFGVYEDQVDLIRKGLKQELLDRVKTGRLRINGKNVTQREIAGWVKSWTNRVQSIGITSDQMRELLEASRHLHDAQNPHLQKLVKQLMKRTNDYIPPHF
jgi:outer membrane protein OmpA-like peptidoglycan-associated protein